MIEFRIFRNRVAAAVLAGALALFAGSGPATASGPIETSIFAVQGVDVDVTSTDAASAKNQALMDVQEHFLRAGDKMTPYFYDYYQSRPITEERMKAIREGFQKLPLSERSLTTDAVEYQEVTKGVREIYKTSR